MAALPIKRLFDRTKKPAEREACHKVGVFLLQIDRNRYGLGSSGLYHRPPVPRSFTHPLAIIQSQ